MRHHHFTSDPDPTYLNTESDNITSPSMMPGTNLGETDGLTNVLYLQEPGTTSAVSVSDINQGTTGDCFLMSTLGAMAYQSGVQNMNFIQNTIEPFYGNVAAPGFFQVQLYTAGTPIIQSVYDVDFPTDGVNGGVTQAAYNGQKEIWPQVIEEAYAQQNGGMTALNAGGQPSVAMEQLTGQVAKAVSVYGTTFAQMQSWIKNDDLITMDTLPYNGLKDGLVANHSYIFDGMTGTNASNAQVKLINPWGYDNPTPIPFGSLVNASAGVDQIDVGHLATGAGTSLHV